VWHGVTVAAVWLWNVRNHQGRGSGDEFVEVRASQHALEAAKDEGWGEADIAETIKTAQGGFNEFAYEGAYPDQVGWYNPANEMFVGAAWDADKNAFVVTTVLKLDRQTFLRWLARRGK
jgi:hypothetical protein